MYFFFKKQQKIQLSARLLWNLKLQTETAFNYVAQTAIPGGLVQSLVIN